MGIESYLVESQQFRGKARSLRSQKVFLTVRQQ